MPTLPNIQGNQTLDSSKGFNNDYGGLFQRHDLLTLDVGCLARGVGINNHALIFQEADININK